ncbi:hypothetical protein C8R46DRAFT_1212274 [Mycena filopes]|nr:hypothetical protein C8R46DRAFT_1212274 [Mycena filopes]
MARSKKSPAHRGPGSTADNPLTIDIDETHRPEPLDAISRHKLRHLDVPDAPHRIKHWAEVAARRRAAPRSLAATRIRRRRPTPSTTASPSTTAGPSTSVAGIRSTPALHAPSVNEPWMRPRPAPIASSSSTHDVLLVGPTPPPVLLTKGSRVSRARPLTREQLWIGGVQPPERTTDKSHQECGVCKQVKSHPVTKQCGHSHCYPCIRVWLEYHFDCPSCRTVLTRPPIRVFVEEASLEYDHPHWNNKSRVSYSWAGLTFPVAL